jgi:MFS family permease
VTALARARSLPIWRSLDVRDFRLLWASEAVSVVGDQFHYVALSWLVISVTGSGLALGTVLIAIGVPRALLLVPFGVIADRRPSRGLMLAAHVARGVIVGILAGAVLAGVASLPLLALLGALFGAADAAYIPAQQAFLPRTLDEDRLPSGNAVLQGTLQLASIVGPPIAGIAIAAAGTGAAFAVDAVSFFAAALVVAVIGRPGPGVKAALAGTDPTTAPATDTPMAGRSAEGSVHESFGAAIAGGIRYVLADPALTTTMVISLVMNLALNGPAAVGMPWLADQRFGAGPAGLGVMAAAYAAGALGGTAVAGSIRLERKGAVLLGALIVAGTMVAALGLVPWLAAAAVALAVMGATIGFTNVVAVSWLQARVDRSMTGRVMSLVMLMGFGITPLSLGLSGAIIDADPTLLFVGSATIVVGTALVALLTGFPAQFDAPTPRRLDRDAPGAAAA